MKDKIEQWLDAKTAGYRRLTPIKDVINDCLTELQPQWVSVDDLPSKSCHVWANHMHKVRIIKFYYDTFDWSYNGEDIHGIDFTHYMIINEPLPLPPAEELSHEG
jgi:hypothetical protein